VVFLTVWAVALSTVLKALIVTESVPRFVFKILSAYANCAVRSFRASGTLLSAEPQEEVTERKVVFQHQRRVPKHFSVYSVIAAALPRQPFKRTLILTAPVTGPAHHVHHAILPVLQPSSCPDEDN
jgi:hypothetical protein